MDLWQLKIIAELGSTQATCQGIKAGAGVSIISTLAVAEDLQAGKFRALKWTVWILSEIFISPGTDIAAPRLCPRLLSNFSKKSFRTNSLILTQRRKDIKDFFL